MRRMMIAGAALSALALTVSACSGGDDTSSPGEAASSADAGGSDTAPDASGDSTLTVWADNSANTAKAIEPLCQAWAEANGVTCEVKKFNGGGPLNDALVKGAQTGDVPDIFEAAHNGIGGLVDNGVIAPIDLGANAASFNPAALQAVSYQGNNYGVPWAVENIAMLTNKALSPQCPASLDDAVATAKKLIADGTTPSGLGIAMQIGDTGDAYHWYPLYTADGGSTYTLGADDTYDTTDLTTDDAASVAAGNRLKTLVDEGVLKASVSFDIAKEAFSGGQSPFFVTGPWAIPDQKTALGDDLMVCSVPNWQGSSDVSKPYLGIRTFLEPAQAPNKVLADSFLADAVMTTDFMDGMYAVDPRPSAWTESFDKQASDPIVAGFGAYGADGTPMPNIPQQDNWFTNMGLAEYKIATGTPVEDALKEATDAIAAANEKLG